MKFKAYARWARLFAQSDIPIAMRELAPGLALQSLNDLTEDLILEA
jgi:hypothetical protein